MTEVHERVIRALEGAESADVVAALGSVLIAVFDLTYAEPLTEFDRFAQRMRALLQAAAKQSGRSITAGNSRSRNPTAN